MTRPTFKYIAYLVQYLIVKRDTRFRKAIPEEKRVAIALWKLATRNSYRSSGKKCCGKINGCLNYRRILQLYTEMPPDFIVFLKTERETPEAIIRFAEFSYCKIPQVVGVIDGVEIQKQPLEVFFKKGVLKNFAKLTRKHLCQSIF